MNRRILTLMIAVLLGSLTSVAQISTAEVLLETTEGNIRIALYDETPMHRDNFLKLIKMHIYDSLLFHRVIKDFMIQSGDTNSKNAKPGQQLGTGDFDYTVEPEFRLPQIFHRRGCVAMAREPDNVNPEMRKMIKTYKSVGGTPHLDGQYTVFGEVTEGLNIVERIQKAETDDYDRPFEDIRILRASVTKDIPKTTVTKVVKKR